MPRFDPMQPQRNRRLFGSKDIGFLVFLGLLAACQAPLGSLPEALPPVYEPLALQARPSPPTEVAARLADLDASMQATWRSRWVEEGLAAPLTIPEAIPEFFMVALTPTLELWIASYAFPWANYLNSYLIRDVPRSRVGPRLDLWEVRDSIHELLAQDHPWPEPRSALVERVDVDHDGQTEIALYTHEHNGTLWDAQGSLIYRIHTDLGLKPVVSLLHAVHDVPTGGTLVSEVSSTPSAIHVRFLREHENPNLAHEVARQLLTRPSPTAPFTVEASASTDPQRDYSFLSRHDPLEIALPPSGLHAMSTVTPQPATPPAPALPPRSP